jgi:apolipoprotein N-acyltransferase
VSNESFTFAIFGFCHLDFGFSIFGINMRWKNIGLAFLSGILLIIIFPKFNLSFLAWIALVPLFLALEGRNLRGSFNLGFLAGLVSFMGILYWIVPTIVTSGESRLLGYISLLLLSCYLSIYYGLFCLILRYLSLKITHYNLSLFFAPALWVSLELLRAHLFSGFPWALLGYSQWKFIPLIQISEFTGVYGVSFLLVMVNGVLAHIARSIWWSREKEIISMTETKGRTLPLAITTLVVLSSFTYGLLVMLEGFPAASPIPPDARLVTRVALLQGNIDQYMKWDEKYTQLIKDTYGKLVDMASQENPQLIVWPETALPGYLRREKELREWTEKVVSQTDAYHIIGSPEYREGVYYNAAFLVSPKGEILDEYDKIHLVPFGEMVPLRPILSRFVGVLNELGDFSPSGERRLLRTPFGSFAVLICWEGIFPHLVRKFVKDGADYMVNITNDAWFLRTSAPYQHFIASIFRAVENRVSIIRVANTGVSGFIDQYGRITKKTEIFNQGYLTSSVSRRSRQTFYTTYGDIFAYLCIALSISFIAWRRFKC